MVDLPGFSRVGRFCTVSFCLRSAAGAAPVSYTHLDVYKRQDMACIGWARGWEKQGQDLKQFPNVARWLETMLARPAVQRLSLIHI